METSGVPYKMSQGELSELRRQAIFEVLESSEEGSEGSDTVQRSLCPAPCCVEENF